jgi:hypothetical protein
MINIWHRLKRPALYLAIIIIIVGIIFIGLDILDIAESYRLYWPIATINTIFISAVALLIVFFTTRRYLHSGSPEILALGGGVLSFGFSIILYGWLTNTDLNTRITAYDSGVLLASVVFLAGAVYGMTKQDFKEPNTRRKITGIVIIYAAILLIIGLITWLAHQDTITFFTKIFTVHLAVRDIVQGIAAVFCVVAALIYLIKYRRLRADSYYWYPLGLVLFAAGVLFISRGPLESRIAWLGRLSQYVGWFYFLLAALSTRKQSETDSE